MPSKSNSIHEAGHAVVAWYLNCEVEDMEPRFTNLICPDKYYEVITMAGIVAESAISKKGLKFYFQRYKYLELVTGEKGDVAEVDDCIMECIGEYQDTDKWKNDYLRFQKSIVDQTRRHVRENIEIIKALAD